MAVRLRHRISGVSDWARRAGQQGCADRRCRCRRSWCSPSLRKPADGAPADIERVGHRGQRCLGRSAVHGLRAYPDDRGAVVLGADTGTRRAGPYPDSDPHITIIDVQSQSGRLRPGQAGVTRSTVPRSRTAVRHPQWLDTDDQVDGAGMADLRVARRGLVAPDRLVNEGEPQVSLVIGVRELDAGCMPWTAPRITRQHAPYLAGEQCWRPGWSSTGRLCWESAVG